MRIKINRIFTTLARRWRVGYELRGKSSSMDGMVMEACGVASCDCFGGDTSRGGRRIEVPSDGRNVAPNVRQQFCVPAGNVEVFDCLRERERRETESESFEEILLSVL